jgi:SPP1 gp7 family putative phage head morphogenesis protein
MQCQIKGQPGYKFGTSGKCFTGPGAREKAAKQGRAIKASQFKRDQVFFSFLKGSEARKQLLIARRNFMQQAGQRVPRQGKRAPRMATAKTIQMEYFSSILRLIQPAFDLTKELIFPRLPEIIRQFEEETRIDQSSGEIITQMFGDVEVGFAGAFPESLLKSRTEDFGNRTSDFNRTQNDKVVRSLLGVNPIRSETYLIPQVEAFVERNVALIKTIPADYLKQIETIIRARIDEGASTTAIQNEIVERFGSTRNRARLIARDQIGKFMGKLSELRQREIGVTHYFWETADDERVRPDIRLKAKARAKIVSHRVLDGQRYSWEKPPVSGTKGERQHPGIPISCRCFPRPDLSGFFASSQPFMAVM